MNPILFVCLWIAVGSANVFVPANSSNIVYSGRYQQLPGDSSISFDWSGFIIETLFNGTSISAMLNDQGNFYNIFIDGELFQVLNTTSQYDNFMIASDLEDGVHHLMMTKRTEAFFGVVTLAGFYIDDDAILFPMNYKQSGRKIEFVGDSITCGFGDGGEVPCDFTAATENNWLSWGPLTARNLSAEYHLEAWSGKGVIRNCCNQNITTPDPFPTYWNRTLANIPSSTWNYNNWIPDAVVINLGTNDYSTNPAPPQDLFENAYIEFVQTIQENYNNSDLVVFLACGPMIGDPCCDYVQNVVSTLGGQVYYMNLQGILSYPSDFGCDGHPNYIGHQIMSEYAIPVIQKILDW